jgi:hypothetical protein
LCHSAESVASREGRSKAKSPSQSWEIQAGLRYRVQKIPFLECVMIFGARRNVLGSSINCPVAGAVIIDSDARHAFTVLRARYVSRHSTPESCSPIVGKVPACMYAHDKHLPWSISPDFVGFGFSCFSARGKETKLSRVPYKDARRPIFTLAGRLTHSKESLLPVD